jgi:lipopolysaccharide transport system permease protein
MQASTPEQAPRPSYVHEDSRTNGVERFVTLLAALVVREFKGQYRRSVLGPGWAVLQPLLYMAIFIFIRGVVGIESGETPYPLFVLCGLLPWTFFANGVSRSGVSIYLNAGVIKKIPVRREVYPSSGVALSLIDMAIAFVILGGFMAYYRIVPGAALVWLPVLVAMSFLLALGVGLGFSALGTFKRDFLFGIPFLLQFWLLASPVMYPMDGVTGLRRTVLTVNPVSGIVEGFRRVLLENAAPDLALLGTSALAIAVIWAIAWPLFHYLSQYFADVM